ncbi:hypothetical protein CYMTET_30117 [Cymbomonas tetramitiformis]|uniref:Uncharacterized protein n=1 Tax=Cymbomonas tetramitiformis TaxID=36881 RepID=A0AAE0KU89_9CHLO|nr:hypothetical protein CYMTET_30117 [Cymbomonas tetramitiformis]
MECPASFCEWVRGYVPLLYNVNEQTLDPMYMAFRLHAWRETPESARDVVPVEQVHRLVQMFNTMNSVDTTKVNCKVIVDTLAGGAGILEQVSSQLSKSSLKPADFKEYVFIYVNHPEIKKSVKKSRAWTFR